MKLSQNQISSFIKTIQDNSEIISEIYTPYTQTPVDIFKILQMYLKREIKSR